MNRFSRWQELILPVGMVSSVLVILVPLPTGIMDLLLAANITIAVIVLLTTIYVREAVRLLTGQTIDLSLEMGLAASEDVITVTAEAPVIEVSRSSALLQEYCFNSQF